MRERIRRFLRRLARVETQTCPRRLGMPGPWAYTEGLDTWERRGDDRVCSFCGSMHPEDFERFLKQVVEDPDVNLRMDQSDKSYKVYVIRPDVLNASGGAIKYYKQHTNQLDTADKERLQQLYAAAYDVSREKWSRWFEQVKKEIRQ